jgi:hypothetical protein
MGNKDPKIFVLAGFQIEDVPGLDGIALKVKHSIGMHATSRPEIHVTHLLIRRAHALQLRDEIECMLSKRPSLNS